MSGESVLMSDQSESVPTSGNKHALSASVIVCVYNRPRQIVACLESLLRQDYRPLEIIVVDDGSTDETPAVLADFQKKHQNGTIPIRVVRSTSNLGVCGARNIGLKAASSDLVLYTDSDCEAHPSWVSAIVDALSTHEFAGAAGRVIDHPPRNWAEWAASGNTSLRNHKLQGRSLVGCNMAFIRGLLVRYAFDELVKYGADEDDLARRMARDGHRLAFVEQAIVYHHHPMTIRSYLRHAWRQGQGSAWYWWKHRIFVGRDLLFLFLALTTLPLVLIDVRLLAIPVACFALHVAAHAFNERVFKGKSWLRTFYVLPLVVTHSIVKLASVIWWWISNLPLRNRKNTKK